MGNDPKNIQVNLDELHGTQTSDTSISKNNHIQNTTVNSISSQGYEKMIGVEHYSNNESSKKQAK